MTLQLIKKCTLILVFLCLIVTQLLGKSNQNSIAYNGALDLRNNTWLSDETVRLDGIWEFYWDEILTLQELSEKEKNKSFFQLPNLWSVPSVNQEVYPAFGHATFTLKIFGDFKDREMALEMPTSYCSYTLFVNGLEIANNGTVAKNKNDAKPYWQPTAGDFTSERDTLQIILQISNYHHSKGGISESIVLGSKATVSKNLRQRKNGNYIHIIGIGLLSLLTLIAFSIYRKTFLLWFSIFSLMWSLRGIFSNMYLIHDWIPDFSWVIGAKIEYLTLYFSLLIGVHLFHRLYSKYTYSIANKISIAVNTLFILITIVSSVAFYSELLNVFFIFLGLMLTYVLISLLNALIHSEKGSISLTVGVLIIILLFFYDLFSYQQIVSANPYILNIGYVVVYYLLGISLIYHVTTKKNSKAQKPNFL